MAVRCARCGEELLGAVNRCWRCGTKAALSAEDPQVPPVRRSPVSGPLYVDPSSGDEVVVAEVGAEPPLETKVLPVVGPRQGSPFRAGTQASTRRGWNERMRATQEKFNGASTGAAIASLVLGLASVPLCAAFPMGGFLVCLIGFVMGLWGLYSNRRLFAIIGLALCCLLLSISTYLLVIQIYTRVTGNSPWSVSQ